MKKYILWYYLLFMLLIMGTFASMAQNEYGNVLLGCVAFAFAFLFMLQLLGSTTWPDRDHVAQLELISLLMLALILGLRVFYLRFPGVEWVYAGAGGLLVVVHLVRMFAHRRMYVRQNGILSWLIVMFHLTVIVYVLSMVLVPFAPAVGRPAGEIAFVFLLVFLVVGYVNRKLSVEGETVSVWRVISRWNDQSVIVVGLFALFTAYLGMTQFDAMPRMHSDEMPSAYFELLQKADSEANQQKAESFRQQYDRFVLHQDARE